MPRHVLVFDVNETLLDLAALDPEFERVFGDASVRKQWFQQMLASAFVSTITSKYADFGTLGRGALDMIAQRVGKTLSDADRQAILGTMRRLPPHPEARRALEHLRERGFRLATLTNSTIEVAEAQMANSGLRPLFEQVLSADTVKRLKPAPEPYAHAAERLGVGMDKVRLVAAHFWDVAGALRAGCAAAFVARPGQILDPNMERPDVVGPNLSAVAEQIVALDL
ncbi:MAG: haloacid dehalogenase, type II [Chloroflexi bacterium 13_1_40CM_4_68_4]|nr:MAG: haloacid dehalogenase, type II [Chloroflexi bacterium 13_1_40CM_4_68_4]